jgi:hypothetical protein
MFMGSGLFPYSDLSHRRIGEAGPTLRIWPISDAMNTFLNAEVPIVLQGASWKDIALFIFQKTQRAGTVKD